MTCKYPIHYININDYYSRLKSKTFENQIIYYFAHGKIAQIKHIKDNKYIPLFDKPSIIRYYFSTDDKLHPYEEFFFRNDRCYLGKEYYEDGTLASIAKFYDESNISEENNTQYHCSDGPAIINYNRNGKLSDTEYYFAKSPNDYSKKLGKNLILPDGPDSVKNYCLNLELLQ